MDILVTGANGFLGKAIIKELENNNNLNSLSKTSGDYQVSLDNDIPNFKKKFDLVIHAAGKAHCISKNELEKREFHKVNVVGTENLLKGLQNTGLPQQFVFISSVSVYGQQFGIGISEEHSLKAKDAYGLSKVEAEKKVKDWCEKYNVICTILRLPLLVGKNPPGNLGAMVKAIEKGYYFNIGGGKAQKSMVLVEDVALIMLKVASVGGTYNLTDGYHPSFHELSTAISEQKNKNLPFNLPIFIAKIMGLIGDSMAGKAPINSMKLKKIISDLTFDDNKATESLGWKPQRVLEYLKNNSL